MQYLFLHGLGQTSSSWNDVILGLTDINQVTCPELKQFLTPENATYNDLYHNFLTYCDSSKEPLHLCGLSLGAILALNYAIDFPAKVQSLVLIAPQYHMPKLLLKFQNIVFRWMPESAFSSMGMQKDEFIQLSNSMMHLNFSDGLKNISCPTLVVCGEKDTANKKAAKKIAGTLQYAELHLIVDAKHEVNIEAPEKLSKLLNTFYYNMQHK
ncbi:MAG: alpha/beta fold hydrolase [Ruminococcus sp.]